MKEIGGYIELDNYIGKSYHDMAISFNSGRSCLAYLIEKKHISRLFIPKLLCDSVLETCQRYSVDVVEYSIDENFRPIIPFTDDSDYIYIVNYYGLLSVEDINSYKARFKHIILDNAQAYFSTPIEGLDTIYIARKFFGVADGAYLYTDLLHDKEYPRDVVNGRMRYLFGRYEEDASKFYDEYVKSNNWFSEKPIMKISSVSENMLRAIDYDEVCHRRTENYAFLNRKIGDLNKLVLNLVEGAFAYPLLVYNGRKIKEQLIKSKIYVPTLWPDVFERCKESEIEYNYADNIIPLPVDQRYNEDDMEMISNILLSLIC